MLDSIRLFRTTQAAGPATWPPRRPEARAGRWVAPTRPHGLAVAALGGALVVAAFGGCRGQAEGYERFVPEPGPARAAVDAVLRAWVAGRPPEPPAARNPEVYVVDRHRKAGQRLVRYAILGEVPTDRARGFATRLTFEDPAGQEVVRFLAVGRSPVWVFRQEDYEMISHWMHAMDDPGAAPAPAGSALEGSVAP